MGLCGSSRCSGGVALAVRLQAQTIRMWLGSLGNILAGNCLQPPPFHSHPRLSLAAPRALLSPDQMIFCLFLRTSSWGEGAGISCSVLRDRKGARNCLPGPSFLLPPLLPVFWTTYSKQSHWTPLLPSSLTHRKLQIQWTSV